VKVYSFPLGGISFDDPAAPPRDPSVTAFLPTLSVIPLLQHPGAPAAPLVAVGDPVREGMLVGRAQGNGSANIHASVPGKVIRTVSWKTPEGRTNKALVIRMEGTFEKLGKPIEYFPWEGMSPYELQRLIGRSGIVEMEGEGRPLSDLLSYLMSVPQNVSLVVRCVFDDPWMAADQALCRERIQAVVEGSIILGRAARASRIIFAVSNKERDLGKKMLEAAETWSCPAFLVLTGSKYPQRNRRELELVLSRWARDQGIDLGVLFILGPAAIAASYDAVKLNRPILDRYVAVGGSAVKTPQVMKVRIGTRIGEVFAQCGGFVGKPRRIAIGSPLLGRELIDLDEPVTKTCFAVFALLKGRGRGEETGSCICCGECRKVCPVGLDPEELFKRSALLIQGTGPRDISAGRAAECHECGCCEAVCPSRLPLIQSIKDLSQRGI